MLRTCRFHLLLRSMPLGRYDRSAAIWRILRRRDSRLDLRRSFSMCFRPVSYRNTPTKAVAEPATEPQNCNCSGAFVRGNRGLITSSRIRRRATGMKEYSMASYAPPKTLVCGGSSHGQTVRLSGSKSSNSVSSWSAMLYLIRITVRSSPGGEAGRFSSRRSVP